jgi:hypothetical protein
MEGVLEIKLFLKTDEDNLNVGSFMIDLSLLLNGNCKISNNYYTTNTLISFYDHSTKQVDELVQVSLKLSLIKSGKYDE